MHRIGRTARAGAAGEAISLCDNGERQLLRQIERLTRQTLPFTDRRTAGGQRAAAPAEAARPAYGHGAGGNRRDGAARSPNPGRSGARAKPAPRTAQGHRFGDR